MTKKALVTGASSGIGKAISLILLEEGYEVYGIGRTFDDPIEHSSFHPVVLDLCDDRGLDRFLNSFDQKDLTLLVNNAGSAWYGLHESIRGEQIRTMVKTDLEVPMVITAALLRSLRKNQGTVLNIASVTALHPSTHAAAYGAAKAGLLHFTRTLFEENRKYGLRVTAILPDMTDTQLYRNADFTASDEEGAFLPAETVAETVRTILNQPKGTVITELTIRPQRNRLKKKAQSFHDGPKTGIPSTKNL